MAATLKLVASAAHEGGNDMQLWRRLFGSEQAFGRGIGLILKEAMTNSFDTSCAGGHARGGNRWAVSTLCASRNSRKREPSSVQHGDEVLAQTVEHQLAGEKAWISKLAVELVTARGSHT